MFVIQGPYPGPTTTVQLPSPSFSDQEALADEFATRRAMDGTKRTYVKTKGGRRRLTWEFSLQRIIGLQLRAFIRTFFASQILITDHEGRTWIGNFTNNPFELTTERSAAPDQATVRGEKASIRLEFEGIENA